MHGWSSAHDIYINIHAVGTSPTYGMVKEIRIVVHPPSEGFFLSGTAISGEVVVTTGSKKSYYTRVELLLRGSIDSDFTDSDNNTRCTYSDEVVRNTVILWEKSDGNTKFPKGTTELSFTVSIPNSSNVLPCCSGNNTTVRYWLEAVVIKDRRGKADSATVTPVKIFPPVNVAEPSLQGPQTAHNVTPMKSCFCFSGGIVETETRLCHKGYSVAELLELDVEIDNDSRKRITHFDAILVQTILSGGTPKSRLRRRSETGLMQGKESHIIGDKAVGNSIIPRSNWAENLTMRIPEIIPPTFESTDSILSIQYHMLVRVHFSRRNTRDSITLKFPVTIGNCRLHELTPAVDLSDPEFSSGSPPSYFDVLQRNSSIDTSAPSAVPSAPTLPRDQEPL